MVQSLGRERREGEKLFPSPQFEDDLCRVPSPLLSSLRLAFLIIYDPFLSLSLSVPPLCSHALLSSGEEKEKKEWKNEAWVVFSPLFYLQSWEALCQSGRREWAEEREREEGGPDYAPPPLFSFLLFFPRALLHIGGEKEEGFFVGEIDASCIAVRRRIDPSPSFFSASLL